MRHPYAEFLHEIAKPARYIGGEYQSITKDHADVDVTMALAFPDLYDIGMSHLGTKILYSVLNKHPRIAAERCFAPWADLEAKLREHNLPLLSLETAIPLSDFDVVGFSLQYELTFTNVLLMLDLGGIPLRVADRGEDDPLVIAGGPSATHPEAVAPFFDAILVGDGEDRLPELLLEWKKTRRAGMSREDGLVELAKLGGIYVPSLYSLTTDEVTGVQVIDRPIRDGVPASVDRAYVEDINRFPFPDDSPVPEAEAVFDRMAIEIARGCTEGCRFCQAGMIYRPVRERDPRAVVDSVLGAIDKGGYDEVSLTALSTADVSCIAPLIEKVSKELTERKVSMSVSSLRAYGLPGEVLDDISKVRAAGLTFAPEAGTQRMRDVVCKNVTEQDMTDSAHRVFSRGWQKAKLYFMIGLPTEEDSDVEGIVDCGAKIRQIALQYQPKGRVNITVSVSSHVPKPHTPFQWCAMDSREEIARKQALLRSLAKNHKLTLKVHGSEGSYLEGVLGRGDRRIGDVIEWAYKDGARFDGWDEHMDLSRWHRAFEACGVDPEMFLGTIPVTARLPWDHIDVGLVDGFLLKEYQKSLKGRLSPPCGKPFQAKVHHTNLADAVADEKRLVCYDCGVACDLQGMRDERMEFLQVLGAEQPREAAPEIGPSRKSDRHSRTAPEKKFEQGEPLTYRVSYEKVGSVAFTGHLDIVRRVPRLLRRAGLNSYYSQGFHPHPIMSFGPALGLGIASLSEYVDITLTDDLEAAELLSRLRHVSQQGLEVTGVRRQRKGDPSLAKSIGVADYIVAVHGEVPDELIVGDGVVDVIRKKKARQVKMSEAIFDVERISRGEVPERLLMPEEDAYILLRLRTEGGLKPIEAASAIIGDRATAVAISRVGLWSEKLVDPFGGPADDMFTRVRSELTPVVPAPSAKRLPMLNGM